MFHAQRAIGDVNARIKWESLDGKLAHSLQALSWTLAAALVRHRLLQPAPTVQQNFLSLIARCLAPAEPYVVNMGACHLFFP